MAHDSTVFIGGGNMARSLIGGLVARGTPATDIHVVDPIAATREALASDFGVQVHADAGPAVAASQCWVLAVKPQLMREVCQSLAPAAQQQRPLVLSIAAGITAAQLDRWLGGRLPIVRTMPNTPALLGAGVTGLFATPQVDADGRARADALMSSAGETVWIDNEDLMDAVTAVSGSGPAYVFLLAEAMEAAAKAEGLADDAARTLVVQTLLGAARMLAESEVEPAELRRRVTSPNGTTHAAIQSFQQDGLEAMVARAVHAARVRGHELAAANE